MIKKLLSKIRKRETPFWEAVYKAGKRLRKINMPVIWPLYTLLAAERRSRLAIWDKLTSFLYYEPLFKTYCKSCGSGLNLIGGVPQVSDLLSVHVGNGVTMHGVATFVGSKVYSTPELFVGDNTHLGYQMGIAVGRKITIGSHVLIANRVSLAGYDLHPLDPVRRTNNEPPDESGCGDIEIKDYAWIGMNCLIMKGVTVGKASIVAAGSVVTKDVPDFCIVAGNPAKVVKMLDEYRHTLDET